MPARKNSTPVSTQAPVAPLGMAAQIERIKAARPGITTEQAQIMALTMELVTVKREAATLNATVSALVGALGQTDGRVNTLEDQLQKVLEYLLNLQPIKAKVSPAPSAPAPVTAQPAVSASHPKQRVPKAERQDNTLEGWAKVIRQSGAQGGQVGTPAAPPAKKRALSFANDTRLLSLFAAFTAKYGDEAAFTDEIVARPGAAYLRESANAYLDTYQGGNTFLLSVQQRDEDVRTVPQLRGVLNSMLGQYRRSLA